jgi:hypothetical protein
MFPIHNFGRRTDTKRTPVDQIVAIDAPLAESVVVVGVIAVGVVSQPHEQPLLLVSVELMMVVGFEVSGAVVIEPEVVVVVVIVVVVVVG